MDIRNLRTIVSLLEPLSGFKKAAFTHCKIEFCVVDEIRRNVQ